MSKIKKDKIKPTFRIVDTKILDENPDSMILLAVLFSTFALIFKYRVFAWQALVFTMMGLANMRVDKFEWKNFMSAIMLSFTSLLMAYLSPQRYK